MKLKHLQVIFLPCSAHQINLVLKGILTQISNFRQLLKDAINLVGKFNRSAQLLAALQEKRKALNKRPLALVTPVDTRWYSFNDMLHSIYNNKIPLQVLYCKKTDNFLFLQPMFIQALADSDQRVPPIVNQDSFWTQLKSAVKIVSPIVKAQGISESDGCTLADIGLIFGKIHSSFQGIELANVRDAMLQQLDKRWKRFYETPLMVVAIVLHPGMRNQFFAVESDEFSMPQIAKWTSDLYSKLFSKESTTIVKSLVQYVHGEGIFRTATNQMREDPLSFWRLFQSTHKDLSDLATRLAILAPHAAAIERGWSQFGYVQSKGEIPAGSRSMYQHLDCD